MSEEEKKVNFCQMLSDGIKDEEEAVKFYTKLLEAAFKFVPPLEAAFESKEAKDWIEIDKGLTRIYDQEQYHLESLEILRKKHCLEEPLKEAPIREAIKSMDMVLGLNEDPTSAKCAAVLSEGPNCESFRDIRRFIMCVGWDLIDKGTEYREAISRGWAEAKKRCPEL